MNRLGTGFGLAWGKFKSNVRAQLGQGQNAPRCMALVVVLSLAASSALADGGQSLYWQCQPPGAGSPNGGYCPVNQTYRLPVAAANSGVAVAGTQVGLAISSATALTVPSGATVALIQAQGTNNTSGQCLFWRDDGTNPTTTAGQALANGASMYYAIQGLPIKLIAASSATCTATISYYK